MTDTHYVAGTVELDDNGIDQEIRVVHAGNKSLLATAASTAGVFKITLPNNDDVYVYALPPAGHPPRVLGPVTPAEIDDFADAIAIHGPLHWWKFKDDYLDSGSAERNGGEYGAPAFGPSIRNLGRSIQTSENNRVTLGDKVAADFSGAAGITVSAVIKPTANDPDGIGTIFAVGLKSGDGIHVGRFLNTGVRVAARETGGGEKNAFITSAGLANGSPSLLGATFSYGTGAGGALEYVIYVDGVSVKSGILGITADNFSYTQDSLDDGIGGWQSHTAVPSVDEFNGQIQDVATFKKVLTAAEMLALYNAITFA